MKPMMYLPPAMRRSFHLLFTMLALAAAPPLAAQACAPARVALVLSGGGAKGLAHIGVLRVLDSLGVRPDLVVGASMGSVVGGMYASGLPARVIDSLARTLPVSHLFRTFDPEAPRALGGLQPLVVWEHGERGFTLQSAAVREADANALLNAALARGNVIARGDFDRLPIPLRVVATDLATREAVVLAGGDLARAVRASIAIPFIFAPERIDGRFLADGGLSANIPVEIARRAGADVVIVSDATERRTDTLNLYSPFVVAERLLGFLFEQADAELGPRDVYVRPQVDGFLSLDFTATSTDSLIALGAAAARAAFDARSCRPAAGDRTHRPAPVPARVTAVEVPGAPPREVRTIRSLIGLAPGDSLDPAALRRRLRALGTTDRYVALWLTPSGGGDSIAFAVAPARAPSSAAAIGAAYDNDVGGRLWAGVVDHDFFGSGVSASARLAVGNLEKQVVLSARRPGEWLARLVTPVASLTLGSEHTRIFDAAGDQVGLLRSREASGFVGVERDVLRGWTATAGLRGRTWRTPERIVTSAAGVAVDLRGHSLGEPPWFRAGAEWNDRFWRATVEATPVLALGRVTMRPVLRAGSGEDLPVHEALALGGADGFPGYHIGELLGTREALAGLGVGVEVLGPLELRVDGAVGRIAYAGGLLDGDGWRSGVRAGVGAGTPLGDVRVQYGVADDGREAVFVRLGGWF